jgi:uncharacterized protein (DUF4415 family)
MLTKKKPGSAWIDPDDAPKLTADMLENAEYFEGDKFIRRGRGRPKLDAPKEAINLRLDADILTALRAHGPGWQTRVNEILRSALGIAPRQD